MFNSRAFALFVSLVVSISCVDVAAQVASQQEAKKPFTLVDEIGLTLFDNSYGVSSNVEYSPDGKYFAVWSERGRLDLNRVEDSLRIYRCSGVGAFLQNPDTLQPPSPVFLVNRSDITSDAIDHWRWLPDSSGLAFLGHANGGSQLFLADLRAKAVSPLTSTNEVVRKFDVRDGGHYVYTAFDRVEPAKSQRNMRDSSTASYSDGESNTAESPAPTIGTGRSMFELMLPDDQRLLPLPTTHLRAVVLGEHFEVKRDAVPIDPDEFALSPDGKSLVAILPVRDVPSSWETFYPGPISLSPYRIRSGGTAHQFVRVDVKTGSIQSLTDAPMDGDAGWGRGYWHPTWSSDGTAVLLPSTFLSARDHTQSAPCVAVADLSSNTRTCVAVLKGRTDDKGYHYLLALSASFVEGNKERVVVTTVESSSSHTAEYRHQSDGTWQNVAEREGKSIENRANGFEVKVEESFDKPPLLVVKDRHTSRLIWNPNPQLNQIQLGRARVYEWKDEEGRAWKGGLYEPVGYVPGKRYPLVIQTHGFREAEFRPSGVFTTGFAARVLAAAGVVVLQVGESCPIYKPQELTCPVSIYRSAVNQLVSDGLADPDNIGIIGFSRTGMYVLAALTTSGLHFKAASIADASTGSYYAFIDTVDSLQNSGPRQLESMFEGAPFSEGLQQWLKRSPGFNLDKITAPLLVVPASRGALMTMWEPYAGLRYLHRPTDLIILNTDEHVITNPKMRLVSQGGAVDWFRFWLQGYEDPDPSKAEQYKRWHELREQQEANRAAQHNN